MEISDKEWKKFKEWQSKANRDFNTRPYRGRSQRDPNTVIGYHSKAIRPEHPTGERHHLVGLARMNPVFQTIQTKEQLGQFIDELRSNGVALGDSWEQMVELPRELHDSSNLEAIHRVESELGLDDPLRYVPENATFEDALKAIPLIAEDQRSSRKRAQELLFRRNTTGDSIGGTYDGFTDNVLNPPDHRNIASNRHYLNKQLDKGKSLVSRILEHPLTANERVKVQQKHFPNRLTGTADTLDIMFQAQGSSLEEAAEISTRTFKNREAGAEIARKENGLFGMPDLGITETLAGFSLIGGERQRVMKRHLL